MPGSAPVLFLIFNRPEPTRQVFEEIRAYRPSRLYVAADGPRPEKAGEWSRCADARSILNRVDWDCKVRTLFRDQNLGCGTAVSEAINWFFDQEEEGIILEDDCLPDPSFFPFCEEMLDRYRDQPEVGSISGDNFLPRSLHLEQPYGFSKFVQIWGWATWRRFWKRYDFRLAGDWREWLEIINRANPVQNQAKYWFQIFKTLQSGLIDTWDFQVMFSSWRHGYVHVFPSRNLVTNLGYDGDATHTNFHSPLANLQRESLRDYQVTLPIAVDPEVDNAIFYFRFLESLTSVWWLEQAMDLPGMLGWLRAQLDLAKKENAHLKAIQQVQSRAISKIQSVRSRSIIRANYTLLLAHFVYTCRLGLDLARTKANWVIARVGAKANELISRLGVILRIVLLRVRPEATLPPVARDLSVRNNEERASKVEYGIAGTPRDQEHASKDR
ncbi:MAG: hypothetical protein JOZ08_19790 [Verrucomicrobia bacterium]|nr:hypothetical protein [Verrucomicrobiota bacterium]MBV8277656.1 hypothetical protein [Verrucomicrobiota bacterium]